MKKILSAIALATGLVGCDSKTPDETLRIQKTVLSATQTCLSIKESLLEESPQFRTSLGNSVTSVVVGRTSPELTMAMSTLGMTERQGESYLAVEGWDKSLSTKQKVVSLLVDNKLAGCYYYGETITPLFFGRTPSASEQLSHQMNNPYISFSSTP